MMIFEYPVIANQNILPCLASLLSLIPPGHTLVVDDDGSFISDDDGSLLISEI